MIRVKKKTHPQTYQNQTNLLSTQKLMFLCSPLYNNKENDK